MTIIKMPPFHYAKIGKTITEGVVKEIDKFTGNSNG